VFFSLKLSVIDYRAVLENYDEIESIYRFVKQQINRTA